MTAEGRAAVDGFVLRPTPGPAVPRSNTSMPPEPASPHGGLDPLTTYHSRAMVLFEVLHRLAWDLGDDEPRWEDIDRDIKAVHSARTHLEDCRPDLRLFEGIQPAGVETHSVHYPNLGWSLSWHAAMRLKMVEMICDYLTAWVGTEHDTQYTHSYQAHELNWTRPDLGLPDAPGVCRDRGIVWQRVREVYLYVAVKRNSLVPLGSEATYEVVKARKDAPPWTGRLGGWVELTGIDWARQRPALQSEFAAARRALAVSQAPSPPVTFVNLNQIAAMVNRSKDTLERRLNARDSTMPRPDVEGGGGKPHEWHWDRIRPWLVAEFGRDLPERFPAARI